MPLVVLTGGPGVGKTTLLHALAARGYTVVAESAREVIRDRKSRGLPPRPDPAAFARAILRRDLEKYAVVAGRPHWVFLDRSPLESQAMLREASHGTASDDPDLAATVRLHPQVFVLPPWPAIYVQDDERDHSFAHCERVHHGLVGLYRGLGFDLVDVPCVPAAARAEHVLRCLSGVGAHPLAPEADQ